MHKKASKKYRTGGPVKRKAYRTGGPVKVKKMAKGGKTCRGMGAATRGGRFSKTG